MSGELVHGEDCECVRCTGFPKGHELTVRHGAYATVKLQPRAQELADAIREHLPLYDEVDEPVLRLAAMALARVEAAEAALDGANLSERLSLSADARRWQTQALRALTELGASPMARARLGLDVARTVAVGAALSPAEIEGAAEKLRERLAEIVEGEKWSRELDERAAPPLPRFVPAGGVAARQELDRGVRDVEGAAQSLRQRLEKFLPAIPPASTEEVDDDE